MCSVVMSAVDVGCRVLDALVVSEVNCVSDNSCTFLPKLLHLPLPPPELYVGVCMCVCLHSGMLLYYVVVACRSVIELGAVEGTIVDQFNMLPCAYKYLYYNTLLHAFLHKPPLL